MKVLTIIVLYNGMNWLDRCILSLRQSTVPTDVFVVDNGSVDGSQHHLSVCYPEVIFTQSECNLGFGKANNMGLRYAVENGYDYVYLLNQDAWVFPDTIEKLIHVHKLYPEYGILSPIQMQADMLQMDKNFQKGPYSQNPRLKQDEEAGTVKQIYEVETIMAAHWLLPVSTIRKIGGFSPSFPHYGEDDNYACRSQYHGLKVGMIPLCKAVHDRQYRVENKEKTMYLHYVCLLKLFSNPFLSFARSWYRCAGDTLKAMKLFRSLVPLHNVWKILCVWPVIRRNRRISMGTEGPFL